MTTALVRDQPDAHVGAEVTALVDGVEVPALVEPLLRRRRVASLVRRLGGECGGRARLGQQLGRVEVDRLLGRARQGHHEHLVASHRAFHEHRGRHRHEHGVERRPPVFAPALVPGQALRAERVEVRAHQLLFVRAPLVGLQADAEEVRHVDDRRAPRDRLPVHHGERARRALLAPEHVVQPVVAVGDAGQLRLLREPAVGAAHELLDEQPVPGRHAPVVALEEAGQQLSEQGLVEQALGRFSHSASASPGSARNGRCSSASASIATRAEAASQPAI